MYGGAPPVDNPFMAGGAGEVNPFMAQQQQQAAAGQFGYGGMGGMGGMGGFPGYPAGYPATFTGTYQGITTVTAHCLCYKIAQLYYGNTPGMAGPAFGAAPPQVPPRQLPGSAPDNPFAAPACQPAPAPAANPFADCVVATPGSVASPASSHRGSVSAATTQVGIFQQDAY